MIDDVLPAVSLDRLQKVQNALARVVVPSVRRHHHITPTLKSQNPTLASHSSTNFLQNCCNYLQNASKSSTFIPVRSHCPLYPNKKFRIPWQISPYSPWYSFGKRPTHFFVCRSNYLEFSPPPTSILPNLALVSFLVKNTPFPTIVFFNPDRYME